jgi:hypothetical protein
MAERVKTFFYYSNLLANTLLIATRSPKNNRGDHRISKHYGFQLGINLKLSRSLSMKHLPEQGGGYYSHGHDE